MAPQSEAVYPGFEGFVPLKEWLTLIMMQLTLAGHWEWFMRYTCLVVPMDFSILFADSGDLAVLRRRKSERVHSWMSPRFSVSYHNSSRTFILHQHSPTTSVQDRKKKMRLEIDDLCLKTGRGEKSAVCYSVDLRIFWIHTCFHFVLDDCLLKELSSSSFTFHKLELSTVPIQYQSRHCMKH